MGLNTARPLLIGGLRGKLGMLQALSGKRTVAGGHSRASLRQLRRRILLFALRNDPLGCEIKYPNGEADWQTKMMQQTRLVSCK